MARFKVPSEVGILPLYADGSIASFQNILILNKMLGDRMDVPHCGRSQVSAVGIVIGYRWDGERVGLCISPGAGLFF
jgi:hypothetical protein